MLVRNHGDFALIYGSGAADEDDRLPDGGAVLELRLVLAGDLVIQGPTAFSSASLGDLVLWPSSSRKSVRVVEYPAREIRIRLPSMGLDRFANVVVLRSGPETASLIGTVLPAFASATQYHCDNHAAVRDALDRVVHCAASADGTDSWSNLALFSSYRTIVAFVNRRLITGSGLTADTLARDLGISRASLYRIFLGQGGVASYIRRKRLERVVQGVLEARFEKRRIGSVLTRDGFGSFASFCRMVKAIYGMSLTRLRALRLEEQLLSEAARSSAIGSA